MNRNMNNSSPSSSSNDFQSSQSFSRRQWTINSRCSHCGKSSCQIDSIFSLISRSQNSSEEQKLVDQRIQEILFKRSSSSEPPNICEQRLIQWQKSNSLDYHQFVFNPSGGFSSDDPLFSSSIYQRLSSCPPIQTFSTQNRAGFYQLCSNGCYIVADDSCQTYKGHRLSQSMRCLTIYNQYEEQCVLMLPEFNPMSQIDTIQSITWHENLQIFLFITYHRLYQCEPESGTIRQLIDYEIPSSRHSLAHLTTDHHSFLFLVYQYPTVCLDLWKISSIHQNCSLIKRWSSKELFPRANLHDDDDIDDDLDEDMSSVCGISSMRFANSSLHFLARHERHWSLHLFSFSLNKDKNPILIPQRRIDIDSIHLRCSGENFQMEILPGDQGWLFAIRRPYLIHLDSNGKNVRQISLSTTKRCADSISNVCIMDERGKRRENSKYLVVRDMNSIRFYKL